MKLVFASVSGKLPEWLDALSEEYSHRLSQWIKAEAVLLKSPKLSRDEAEAKIRSESEVILNFLEDQDFLVLCDEKGKSYSSLAFSRELEKILNRGAKRIVFLIGGAYGVADEVKARAQMKLSLSSFTLNHHLAMAVLSEQVYRAMTILKGVRYHNE